MSRAALLATLAVLVVAGSFVSPAGGSGARGISNTPRPTATAPSLHWHFHYSRTAPSPRNWVAMSYDSSSNLTVLYGGYNPAASTAFFSDTWTYKAGRWTQLSPLSHPSATSGLVLADDPALKGVLAFGGQSAYGTTYYNETWLFKAGSWSLLSPVTSPSPRSQYGMVYDNATSEMILFGGNDGGSQFLSDTWEFNGTTWTQVHSAKVPSGRAYDGLVYDGNTRSILLLGGENYSLGTTPGTWTFSGGQWTKRGGLQNTPLIVFPSLATMTNGTPLLTAGLAAFGTTAYNVTYEFFAGSWHKIAASNRPPPRSNGGFVNDQIDGYFLQFGGEGTGTSGTYYGETWTLT